MKSPFNIVVAGAGLTGLTIAALLGQSDVAEALEITVVDAAPRPVHDPDTDVALRVSAIANGSAELFDRIGAWQHTIDTRACPYDRMRVWDEASSPDSAATLHKHALLADVPLTSVRQVRKVIDQGTYALSE